MKHLLKTSFILLVLMTLNACNNSKKTPKKEIETPKKETLNFEIGKNNAGQFIIGEISPTNLQESILIEKKIITKNEEGTTWNDEYFAVSENGNALLTYNLGKENALYKITVKSNLFKTAKNIGINNTIEDFIKAYPDNTIWYTYVGDIFVIESTSIKAQFILPKNGFKSNKNSLYKSERVYLSLNDFKKNTAITTIKIF